MDNLWQQLSAESSLTQNKVNYNQWLDEFNYQKQQDEIANAFAREQFEYQKQQDAISNSYKSASYSNYSNPYGLYDGSESSLGVLEENNNSNEKSNNSNTSNTKSNKKNAIPIGLRVSDWANRLYANR